ncbi:MAG: cupredoxin family copper-binding protein [Beijerinckiaceae bacterium]
MIARKIILSVFIAFALLSVWVPLTHAEEAAVKIDNFTFNPPLLKVKPGETVTWVNEDDIPHTVVATNHAFKSKAMDTGEKYAFTFTTAGQYEYFCSLHSHMKGTIIVEGEASQK